ncbi:MAG: InlB B-repeat-containing protein, partial [Candidatus Woesearchaeota archaeon]
MPIKREGREIHKNKWFMSLYLIFIIVGIVALSGCAGESQKNEVKLTAEPEEGGEVIGEGTFEVKEKVTVQARPAEGYVF